MSWLCHVLFLLFSLLPTHSFAASSIDVSAKQQVVIAQNRGIATLPFVVKNTDNVAHDFIEELTLPDGWRLLNRSAPFHLEQGESQVRLVHIVAPYYIISGKYRIPYHVVARDFAHIQGSSRIDLLIPESSNLSIRVIEQPSVVIAGEEYTVKLQIKNKGNTPLDLKVKVKDDKGYIASNTISSLKLKPSQIEGLTLQIKTSETAKKSFFHQVLLEMTSSKLQFEKLIKTHIISKTPEGVGHYKKIPSQLKFDFFKRKNLSTLQTEFSAKGYIDDAAQHTVNILVRNNQTSNISSLGSNSEARASYRTTNYSFYLGDRTYQLEGITASSFYGKGLQFEYHPIDKPWRFRSYTATEENDSTIRNDSIKAVEFEFNAADELTIMANIAQQESDNLSQQSEESLIGGQLRWDKYDFYELALSYAKDKDAQAYRIEQEGNIGSFYYDIDIQNADSKFDGEITDRKKEEVTTIYRFNKDKTYLKGAISQSRNNLDRDLSKEIRQQKIQRVGLGQYLTNTHRDSLYLELRQTNDKDLRTHSELNKSEKAVRLEYQANRGNWNINAALEAIAQEDKIKAIQTKKSKQEVSLAYTPNENLRLGLNATNYQYSDTLSNKLNYGLSAYYEINDQQQLSGYWQHHESDHFQLEYNYLFQNGIQLGFAASSETATANTEQNNSYRINFTVPFDTPLYKRKDIGSINGKITDKKTGKPVENAIVHVDKYYAVSDKTGHYQFPTLKTGTYRINFDLSKSPFLNYLLEDTKSNEELYVKKNQSTEYNVSLLYGTSIEGQVVQYQPSSGSILGDKNTSLTPSGGVAGLLVTLTNLMDDEKQYKRITTQEGYYRFNGIPAGKWLVEITDPDKLLGDLRIENMQKNVTLTLEEALQVNFKATPYVQKIKKIGPAGGFSVSGE